MKRLLAWRLLQYTVLRLDSSSKHHHHLIRDLLVERQPCCHYQFLVLKRSIAEPTAIWQHLALNIQSLEMSMPTGWTKMTESHIKTWVCLRSGYLLSHQGHTIGIFRFWLQLSDIFLNGILSMVYWGLIQISQISNTNERRSSVKLTNFSRNVGTNPR